MSAGLPMKRLLCSALIAAMLAAGACRREKEGSSLRYEISGTVVSVDKEGKRVTLAHREIPGYMPAMTMPFAVRESWALSVLAPGRQLRGTLVVAGDRSWLEQVTVLEESSPSDTPAAIPAGADPAVGSAVPDFELIDQDGGTFRVSRYRGQAVVVTFIYTRCPLPDYCPRMNRNFSELHSAIVKDASLQAGTRLLTISFDPDFDTPEVLKRYGKGYASRASQEPFRYWVFATGSPAEVGRAARFFGLSYSKESGQFGHSLRTALIDREGKVAALYPGNSWTAGEVLARLRQLPRGH